MRVAIVALALCAIPLETHSADITVATKTPELADWTGTYAGLHSGLVDTKTSFDFDNTATIERFNQRTYRAGWGGQIGYRHQLDHIVVGLETSYLNSFQRRYAYSGATTIADRNRRSRVSDIWSVVAHVGYSYDKSLIYLLSGYANANTSFKAYVTSTNELASYDFSRNNGWVLGGGVEIATTQALSVGVEYKRIAFQTHSRFMTPMTGFGNATVSVVSNNVASAMLRLNYRFPN